MTASARGGLLRVFRFSGVLTKIPLMVSLSNHHSALRQAQGERKIPISKQEIERPWGSPGSMWSWGASQICAEFAMLRVTPGWLSGYAGVILLGVLLVNLAAQSSPHHIRPRSAFYGRQPGPFPLREGYPQHCVECPSYDSVLHLRDASSPLREPSHRWHVYNSLWLGYGPLGVSSSYPFALVLSAMSGFGAGACIVVATGLLAVWFDSRNRGAAAGLAAGGGQLSYVLVGLLVPFLTGRDAEDGWRHAWYLMGAIVMAIGVFSLVFLRDHPRETIVSSKSRGTWPMAAYGARRSGS